MIEISTGDRADMSWQALIRLFGIPAFLTIPPTAIVAVLYYFSVFGDYREIAIADELYPMLQWPLGGIYVWAFVWAVFNYWRLRQWRQGFFVEGCQYGNGPTPQREDAGDACRRGPA
jgi:hypothetical protein